MISASNMYNVINMYNVMYRFFAKLCSLFDITPKTLILVGAGNGNIFSTLTLLVTVLSKVHVCAVNNNYVERYM